MREKLKKLKPTWLTWRHRLPRIGDWDWDLGLARYGARLRWKRTRKYRPAVRKRLKRIWKWVAGREVRSSWDAAVHIWDLEA